MSLGLNIVKFTTVLHEAACHRRTRVTLSLAACRNGCIQQARYARHGCAIISSDAYIRHLYDLGTGLSTALSALKQEARPHAPALQVDKWTANAGLSR
jgi:hypothetical protein